MPARPRTPARSARRLAIIVVAVLCACAGPISWAQPPRTPNGDAPEPSDRKGDADQPEQSYATGLRPPTAAERDWMDRHLVHTGRVRLNPLGWQRVSEFLQGDGGNGPGEAPVSAGLEPPVPFGEEVLPQDPEAAATFETPLAPAAPAGSPPLPPSVDNSKLDAFPPIDTQGSIGSCACFSTTYYTLTHMTCLVRGCNAKSDPTRAVAFSPAFTYNLINGGGDNGSWLTTAYAVMQTNGTPHWKDFPYVGNRSDPLNYLKWPTDFATWRSALDYRIAQTGAIHGVDTDSGLTQLKQLLVNGFVVNYATYISSWQFGKVVNDPSTTADDAYVGKDVATWVNGSSGGHGMTVVGYDDSLWADINANGTVDPGERGALRIANSWGSGWRDGGFTWLAYDALKAVSGVAGGPSTGRQSAFWSSAVYWITARPAYTPLVVGQLTLNTAMRGQVGVRVGVSSPSKTSADTWFTQNAVYYNGGNYGFAGTTAAVDGHFVIDMTDLAGDIRPYRWYAELQDSTAGNASILSNFQAVDVRASSTSTASDTPATADATAVVSRTDLTTGFPALLSEDFEGGLVRARQRGWGVINGGTDGGTTGTPETWTDQNPGHLAVPPPLAGTFMTADNFFYRPHILNEVLVTPDMDWSALGSVRVLFDSAWRQNSSPEPSLRQVDVSYDGGATWQTLASYAWTPWSWNTLGAESEALDLPTSAAHRPRARLRWHLVGAPNGSNQWLTGAATWQVDNVRVLAQDSPLPARTLTIAVTPAGAGSTTPAAGARSVALAVATSVSAAPAGGYRFLRWELTGDGWLDNPSAATAKVTLVGNATLKARFVPSASADPNPQEASPASSPMTAQRNGDGRTSLGFTPGCGAADHAAYWGTGRITSAPQWAGAQCNLGSRGSAELDLPAPAAGSVLYFVVVAQNGSNEGSYGKDSAGQERPAAVPAIAPCVKPRALGGSCTP